MRTKLLAAIFCLMPSAAFAAPADHQHDFDFEFGTWTAHLRVRPPFSTTTKWTHLDGISTVRKVWNGQANLGELDLSNASTHLKGMSLRLFDPKTHYWRLYFANAAVGTEGVPDIGRFDNGHGLFYDHETHEGKPVIVRFDFHDITQRSFEFTQSYSADAGKTWIADWIADFTR